MQLRAFWADAFGEGIFDQSQIESLVAATRAAHANAIVAQVVRRGDCLCLRAGLPLTPGVTAAFDPLQALINTAHAQGIEVHAWVIATAMWNSTTPPADPQHIFNLHGPSASGRDNWVMTRSDGLSKLNDDWLLDPGHPDAAAWVANTALAVVRSYDVDGINLDRIRYPDGNLGTNVPSWGYNPTALARFRADTGRTDTPANTDAQWTQWRRDQITSIVRKVYLEATALKPRIRVSADLITYGNGPQTLGSWEATRAYAEQLQDWRGWLREGILDTAILMNYKRDALTTEPNNQRRMFDEWAAFGKDNQYRRSVAIGTALYLNDVGSSVSQIRRALAPSAAGNSAIGWVGYSYRTPDALTDAGTRSGAVGRAELINALTAPSALDPITPPVFADTPAVPPMSWKTQPVFGHLRGVALASDGSPLADTVVYVADRSAVSVIRSITTDGSGWFGLVDLAPGSYRVTTASSRVSGGVLGDATVSAGEVAMLGPVTGTTPSPTPSPSPSPRACSPTFGAGIAPPATVRSGLDGFHASWFGQSGYATLCPGQTAPAVVAYYNSGTRGWLLGAMGQVAYLGTWEPEPGQDKPSPLGGDGTAGSPNTGWPRFNRVAVQPAQWVGPNQVAWFQFTIVAPSAPGTYRLSIRPLIEGAQWMEDYGVFWVVTVRAP